MSPINLAMALLLSVLALACFMHWAVNDEFSSFLIGLFVAVVGAVNLGVGLP